MKTMLVALSVIGGLWLLPAHSQPNPLLGQAAAVQGDKDPAPSDPNRPVYDTWGNQFDAVGNMVKKGSCTTDPVSGQRNPYCPKPAPVMLPAAEGFRGK